VTVQPLRELRETDAAAVAGLFRAAFGENRPIDAEEIVSWVHNQELDPDWLRVLELDGRVVAYGDIWIAGNELALDAAAPGHWERMFGWAEERARAERVGRVRVFLPAGHELEPWVEERGYRLWRSSYTMEMRLGHAQPSKPQLPAPFELRSYEPRDEAALRSALNEAFAEDAFFNEASPAHFREFYLRARGFDPALWLLAWDGQELAGFLLAFPERAGDPQLGWIESLGVRPAWRRRGIGEGLLRASLGALRARGLRRAGLGVDAENATSAPRLYERVGLRVVRQGNNWTLDL
jgi:ribosomal protein S18 acetylase RimI-like enzyme